MVNDSVFEKIEAGENPDDMVLLKRTLAFVWPYDERQRLIGEHVYEDHDSRELIEIDQADIITAARAAELLAPEIAKVLP